MSWESWKKSFNEWEGNTASTLERVLKDPAVLEPSGALLSALIKVRGAGSRVRNLCLRGLGLATRRDQERTLHLLHELESQLYDLQEKLDEQNKSQR